MLCVVISMWESEGVIIDEEGKSVKSGSESPTWSSRISPTSGGITGTERMATTPVSLGAGRSSEGSEPIKTVRSG